jgi:hypothetical protein
MKMTSSSLSLALDVDKQVCYGFLNFLYETGLATVTPHKVEGAKGKPTNVYDVPENILAECRIPSNAAFDPAKSSNPAMPAVESTATA